MSLPRCSVRAWLPCTACSCQHHLLCRRLPGSPHPRLSPRRHLSRRQGPTSESGPRVIIIVAITTAPIVTTLPGVTIATTIGGTPGRAPHPCPSPVARRERGKESSVSALEVEFVPFRQHPESPRLDRLAGGAVLVQRWIRVVEVGEPDAQLARLHQR